MKGKRNRPDVEDCIPVPERQRMHFEYPDDIDKEMIPLLDALNNIPGVSTLFSCCGHGRGGDDFYIYLTCTSIQSLIRIDKAFDHTVNPQCLETKDDMYIESWYKRELSRLPTPQHNAIGLRISNPAFNYLGEPERKAEYKRICAFL